MDNLIPEGKKKFLYLEIGDKFEYSGVSFVKKTQDLAIDKDDHEVPIAGNEIVIIEKG